MHLSVTLSALSLAGQCPCLSQYKNMSTCLDDLFLVVYGRQWMKHTLSGFGYTGSCCLLDWFNDSFGLLIGFVDSKKNIKYHQTSPFNTSLVLCWHWDCLWETIHTFPVLFPKISCSCFALSLSLSLSLSHYSPLSFSVQVVVHVGW